MLVGMNGSLLRLTNGHDARGKMNLKSGDKVTLTEAARKTVRDPARYRIGTVAGYCANGMVEVLWGERTYALCMHESQIEKLREETQMPLF